MPRRPLTIQQILAWTDRHHELTGQWPQGSTGAVREVFDEKWWNIDAALRIGLRGLPGGSSLAQLLAQARGVRNRKALPEYTLRQILEWADEYHLQHGEWPRAAAGKIANTNGETWCAAEMALAHGQRGLPGGSSLARLFAERRGAFNRLQVPRISVPQILAWADAHHERTGNWPTSTSGPVAPSSPDSWQKVDVALRHGARGLPGGNSLARLLAQHRSVSRHVRKRPLSVDDILKWADTHRARTGKWPSQNSGPIVESPGDTWLRINHALRVGKRGLPGRMTLAGLLAEKRGRRNNLVVPKLSLGQILQWADVHYARYRKWPGKGSGKVIGVSGETWSAVNSALMLGARGLPGGTSLAKLLTEKRGVTHRFQQPPLTSRQILSWADAYHDRTGEWPTVKSGAIGPFMKKTWSQIDNALRHGYRGLPGGQSLSQLLRDRVNASRMVRK